MAATTKTRSLEDLVIWAQECVRRGEPEEALRPLLELYHRTHHPEVADAIDTVSPRPGEGYSSTQHWMARADKRDHRDVPELLVGIETSVARTLDKKLPKLETFVRDPRVGARMIAILRDRPPQMGKAAYRAVIECARSHLDPRARPFIAELLSPRMADTVRREMGTVKTLLKLLAANLDTLKVLPPPPDPWAELKELLGKRAPEDSRQDSVDALLRDVYARPDDVGARVVLADALTEQGSPRGELIVLQCNRKEDEPPSRRERELLQKHGLAWAGPIGACLRRSHLVYRRGFLWEAALAHEGDPTLPEWRTVQSLILDANGSALANMVGHKAFSHLRAIHRFPADLLALLRNRELTHVGLKFGNVDWKLLDTLPKLTSFAMHGFADEMADSLRQKKLLRRLSRFTFVPIYVEGFEEFAAELARRVETVGIVSTLGLALSGSGHDFSAHATRGGAVVIRASAGPQDSLHLVESFLDALPKDANYTHWSLSMKGRPQDTEALEGIEAWAKRAGLRRQ